MIRSFAPPMLGCRITIVYVPGGMAGIVNLPSLSVNAWRGVSLPIPILHAGVKSALNNRSPFAVIL
jgi:hypothetical protein